MREEIPFFMQEYHPDRCHGLLPDGFTPDTLHAQLPYIDPIFDVDIMQEVSDFTRPDIPANVDGVREFEVSEDWHPDYPFRPGMIGNV